jgi:valyl-tRNA synthetase
MCIAHPNSEKQLCRVPRSQRGGEIIGRMNIIPQRFTKVYNNWMEGIQDWCISRQLWWGHRIPVWYCFASAAEAEAAGGRGGQYVVAHDEQEAREKVCVASWTPLAFSSLVVPALVCFCKDDSCTRSTLLCNRWSLLQGACVLTACRRTCFPFQCSVCACVRDSYARIA